MKKKIWGVLLSVAVLVTTVNFPTTAGAEENKGGADASGIVVKVSDDMNGSNANESDEIQTVQISAQNQSNMDAVVRIFLLNEDKETADTEVEIPNLCDKDQITDETVQTEMAETLKSALTLESGTNSALDAQWIEKKDDSGNVTAKYLEAALPAGTAAAFDMQLMYRTDEENYTKKTIVRAKAFVDEQDVTKASDVEDEDNEAEVKWEVVKVEEESEAAEESGETAGSAAEVSRIAAKSAVNEIENLKTEDKKVRSNNGFTVYFDPSGNTLAAWSKDAQIYVYGFNSNNDNSGTPQAMQRSEHSGLSNGWQFTFEKEYKNVIFLNQQNWPSNTNQSSVTVDLAVNQSYVSPCFKLTGEFDNTSGGKKKAEQRDLGADTYAGTTLKFFDMTSSLEQSDVTAVFQTENGTKKEKINISGSFQIPEDAENGAYTKVKFTVNESDTAWYDLSDIVETGQTTFYYGRSTLSNGETISGWGMDISADAELSGKKLYFSKDDFSNADKIVIGSVNGQISEKNESDETVLYYEFPDGAGITQQSVIAIQSGENTYRFMWGDLSYNKVTVTEKIAEVNEAYAAAQTIYFDATLSKLDYVKTATAANGNEMDETSEPGSAIPALENGTVYYWIRKNEQDTNGIKGSLQHDNGDVYSLYVQAGYTQIVFSNYEFTGNNGLSYTGDSTDWLDIPAAYEKPCFYADSGDDSTYNIKDTDKHRGGYWGELGETRDAEKGKAGSDVVDIDQEPFVRDTEKLYVNTTFYDYYTDYELNGFNRDDYEDYTGQTTGQNPVESQRSWVPFRLFDQTLSDYYETHNITIPIYTGHFQSDVNTASANRFTHIADSLNLFGWENQNAFFSTNNSAIDVKGESHSDYGNEAFYDYAAQGLVNDILQDGQLIGKGRSSAEPHFNKEFLEGENSRNTVLGEVYENVAFPFKKELIGGAYYWSFDSADTTLEMRKDPESSQYYLKEIADSGQRDRHKNVNAASNTNGVSTTYGFFPFNSGSTSAKASTYNYGFGTKIEFDFRLTEDGTVIAEDGSGKEVPITFEFSGDDDIWVFIDGKLALDVGGAHGVVTGELDFQSKKATVTNVKRSQGSDVECTGDYTTGFQIEGKNEDTHTLTMFYMERGMWESNMKITFNFPDENQFQVEKKVDDSDMNEIFQEENLGYDLFEGQSVFPFVIENQATHYKETNVTTDESAPKPEVYNNTFDSGTLEQPSGGGGGITWQHEEGKDGKNNVVHWHASGSDPNGDYKKQRWGIIKPATGGSFDASEQNAYLRFSLYFEDNTTPTLNNMYLELEDEFENKLSGYLSGKTYGNASLTQKAWNTIQVDLSKMDKIGGDFDFSRIKNIKFSYNLDKNIYLDDFTFIPSTTVSGETGFTTAQVDIPSYGSVGSGTLMYPEGAVYTLSGNGSDTTNRIGSDGMFALADGQTATFSDQFRRGSYIALTENVNTDLFDTTWTLYENGAPVKEIKDGKTVNTENKVSSLENVKGTTLRDGRQEEYQSGENSNGEISNVGYRQTGWAKNRDENKTDNENTIVFRSYANPDNTTIPTKLKAVFTNKVKTGSIVIQKKTNDENTVLQGKYTFTVTFTNVAGLGLEKAPITENYTINLRDSDTSNDEIRIDGIPAGTVYQITETGTSDESVLEKADFASNNMESDKGYSNETKTVEGKMVVFGTEKGQSEAPKICKDEDAEAVVQFYNTLKKTIDITVEKKWEQMPDDVQYPESIKVQLQRRETDADEWKPVDYEGTGNNYVTINQDYEGNWKYDFEGLEQFADSPTNSKPYQYRIVELDEHNNVIESEGYLNNLFKVTYSDEYISVTDPASDTPNDYTITNTYNPEGTVKIIKENGEGDFLEGAEFALYTDKDCNTIATDSEGNELKGTTEVDRVLIFDNIPAGTKDKPMTYYLKELKTAAGYVLLKEPIEVKLPYEYHVGDIVNGDEVTEDGMTWSLTYTIVNDKAFDLPASGLSGIGPIAAAGIAIVVIAGAVFAARNIKGQRAASNRRKRRPH